MHLLTWHGTLVCAPGPDGVPRHHRLPLAPGLKPLAFDLPSQVQPAEIAHPVLGHLTLRAAPASPCVHIWRAGFFMCAEPRHNVMAFDRATPNGWETFLPLTADALADLDWILTSSWVDGRTRAFVRRDGSAIEESFWLRVGFFAADLTDGLDAVIAERSNSGAPSRLRLGADDNAQEMFAAPAGASALVVTARRSTKGRRMAEALTLAAFRHLGRREPDQAEFDEACAKLDASWGPAGIEDLFDGIVPLALGEVAAAAPPWSAEPKSGRAEAASPDQGGAEPVAASQQAEADFKSGKAAHARGAYAEAERLWSECLRRNPRHAAAALGLATLLWGLGRHFDAMQRLRDFLSQAPHAVDARLVLAARYAELGWLDRAEAECAKEQAPLFGWMLSARQSMQARLTAQRADAQTLIEASRVRSLTADDQLRLARSLFACGDTVACEAVLRDWLAGGALPGEAWLLASELALRQSGPEAALQRSSEAPATARRHAPLVLFNARLRLALGETAQAAEALKFLAAARPSHEAYVLLGRALLAQGDHTGLAKITRDWMAFEPRDVQAAMFCIEAARAAGRIAMLGDAAPGPVAGPADIVQYWNTVALPDEVATTTASWPALNPFARHSVFNDGEARAFIAQNHGGKILQAYEAAYHPAMRSDIFRLAYLSIHGGCYADADELCVGSIERLFASLAEVDFVGVLSGETPPYVHNSFFLVRPNTSLLREALIEACSAVVHQAGKGQKPDMWQVTGPGLITRAVARALSDSAAGFRAVLLSPDEITGFSRTLELDYKRTSLGNWRVA